MTKTRKSVSRGLSKIDDIIKSHKETAQKIIKETEDRMKNIFNSRNAPNAEDLSMEDLYRYRELHKSDKINMATQNALSTVPVSWLSENRNYLLSVNYAYSHLPEYCLRPTSQERSGRCWIFAALNTMRYNIIKKLNLTPSFELSEAFLFFYDKIERSLYFLEKAVEFRNVPVHDIVVNGMTTHFSPMSDGGTWSFFSNLINKYGIVPKTIYGETFNTADTSEMNQVLYDKLAQFFIAIRKASKKSDKQLQKQIRNKYMPIIYSLMIKFMGEPPNTFNWCYHEAGDNFEGVRERGTYRTIAGLTPLDFYHSIIDDNVSDKVVLRHDPRESSEYYRTYHVKHFGSMVGGAPDIVLNVPWEVLSKTAAKAVMEGKQLWFSADVGRSMNYEYGLLSTEAYQYDLTLNTSLHIDKCDALDSHVSGPSHAMALVGVDLQDNDPAKVVKWKVENSWGESSGGDDPGYLSMTEEWFKKYGYEVVVDKCFLDEETYNAWLKYEFNPILLPYNDAFGAVARQCEKCNS